MVAMFDELLELGAFFQTPVRQLSLGQRMRADIGAALLHNPDVLFLDEPTIGLDVVAKSRIRQFIHQINAERQVTVVLTTHDLDDVEKLCNRVILIDDARLLFDGELATLRRMLSKGAAAQCRLRRGLSGRSRPSRADYASGRHTCAVSLLP